MAQRLQHRPPSLRDRLADASRLCSTVLTATAQRRSAGWLRALGRCLDRTRNKLPDSDNAWLKTGGNVTSGTPRASEARAAKNKKSAIDRLESRRTTFFTAHAREFTRQNTCASCSREQ